MKDLWNKVYAPTQEQQNLVMEIFKRCSNEECQALVKFGSHMYAEGWKDYMLPFMGIGAVIGVLIGRRSKK